MNYGRVNFIPRLGNSSFFDNQFTLNGTFDNYGKSLIDDADLDTGGGGTINNRGIFEVASRGKLAGHYSPNEIKYTQFSGETIVNGIFEPGSIFIVGGTLSGTGEISAVFTHILDKVTLAPGAPYGTLTITPDGGNFMCLKCSVDVELSGATSSDELRINGSFYTYDWKLNVLLREGYIPTSGTSFVIVSANNITNYGSRPTYNLPELPNGRSWSIDNDGTKITLTAN